jgi:phosphatidylglycerophosphatase A
MRWFVKALATVGGLGYAPIAPGTAGSLAGLVLGVWGPREPGAVLLGWVVGGFLLGVTVSTAAERLIGTHDPSAVVIDEAWAMWVIMLSIPPVVSSGFVAAVAFVLFRAFDVVKPPPLRWMSRAPGGWGIMLDDLGAAAYTILLLQFFLSASH